MLSLSAPVNKRRNAPHFCKHFKLVGFGPCFLPSSTFDSYSAAELARIEAGKNDTSGWTLRNSRVYGYGTRKTARDGDISDSIGDRGRIF